MRVLDNPQEAVGGMWEEIGKLQFDFLRSQGLQPAHTLLDIGCGTLRGGRHFIRYLDAGNYTGLDISAEAIESARGLVDREGLADKMPRLLVHAGALRFQEFSGEHFDYLLAQSVFTHLPPEYVRECLACVSNVMQEDSVFLFNFSNRESSRPLDRKDFVYPRTFFASIADENSLSLSDHSAAYAHPRGGQMAAVRRSRSQ